ncbi:hypothetical protein QZH41_016380 [Actinostola sp. cb2023]|nr:hypothetical protein QZH41_016380 [Actinostola sp. cb2023]
MKEKPSPHPKHKATTNSIPSFRSLEFHEIFNRTGKLVSNTTNDIVSKHGSIIPTNTAPPPFNYLWTTQWGKQNTTAWKLIYGDVSCPVNPKRKTFIAILKKWIEVAEKNNIRYAFVFGSLLGIVRNNDVLPWDHDMDIWIEYKDILKLEKLAGWPRNIHTWDGKTYINAIPRSEHNKSADDRIRWDCQGKVAATHVDQCAIQEPFVRLYNNAAFLDVFEYYAIKDTLEMVSEGHRTVIQQKDYFPLRRCIFMGFDGWCPNNPKTVLTYWYGKDYMTSVKMCKNGHWV